MSSRVLCSRHGFKAYTRASQAIGDRIKTRSQFASNELIKVAVDRVKRSYQVWSDRSALVEYANLANLSDGVLHLNVPQEIAAFERSLVPVCPDCLNELLVRSGETPDAATSREQALDMSPIAVGAQLGDAVLACRYHGIVFPTRSSPLVSSAIERLDAVDAANLVRILVTSGARQTEYWVDSEFAENVLHIDLSSPEKSYHLEDKESIDALLDRSEKVCRQCLKDLLQRSGIKQPE